MNKKVQPEEEKRKAKAWQKGRELFQEILSEWYNLGKDFARSGIIGDMIEEFMLEYKEYTVEPLIYALIEEENDKDLYEDDIKFLISQIKELKSIEALEKILEHENPAMREVAQKLWSNHGFANRKEALQNLQKNDTDLGYKQLIEDFKKGKEYAFQTLMERQDPACVDLLIEVLNNDKLEVRRNAAYILGNIGDDRAVEPLIFQLNNDKYNSGKRAAARALGNLRDKRAVNPLLALLNEKDRELKAQAAVSLGFLGDKKAVKPLIDIVKETDSDCGWHKNLRGCIASAFGELKDPESLDSLLLLLGDNDNYVTSLATFALKELGEIAVDPLIEIIEKGRVGYDENQRNKKISEDSVIDIIGHFAIKGNSKAQEILLKILSDKNSLLKKYAIDALGSIKSPEVTQALEEAMEEVIGLKNEDYLIEALHVALGKHGLDSVLECLLKFMGIEYLAGCHGSKDVIDALGELGNDKAVEVLLKKYQSNETYSKEAAYALGLIGDSRATPALLRELNSKNKWARYTAAIALGFLKDERAVETLLEILELKNFTTYPGYDASSESLRISLTQRYYEEKIKAIKALGELRNKKAIKPLNNLHELEQKNEVKDAIRVALEKIG